MALRIRAVRSFGAHLPFTWSAQGHRRLPIAFTAKTAHQLAIGIDPPHMAVAATI